MKEHEFANLLSSLDAPVEPPEGLKESILEKVIIQGGIQEPVLSMFERMIFEKPLRTAGLVSAAVSGFLWIVLGSGFPLLINHWIG